MKVTSLSWKLVLLLGTLVVSLAPQMPPAVAASTTFTATADAYVSTASRNSNYGNSSILEIQNGKQSKVSYVRFDLSGLQTPLKSAALRLHAAAADSCSSAAGVEVYRAASTGWDELRLTWKNQPGSTGPRLSTADGYAGGSYISLDVTAGISSLQGAVAFVLKMPTCGTALNQFSSRESANKPQLVIDSGDTVDPPPAPGCDGVHLYPGADLASAINGTTHTTFCIHAGTYNLGNASLHPGSGDKLIGDDVTITGHGRVDAPTKLVSTSPNGVIDFAGPATNVLIENLDISGATGDGTCKPMCGRGINGRGGNGTNLTIHSSRIHHNASNGVGGAKGALLVNAELDHNGATAFLGCCSGGVKSVHPYTVRESYIHDNIGNGAWQDICGTDFVVVYNTITYNTRAGVRYEHNQDCPGNATIKYNTIQNNNTEGKSTDAGGVVVNSAPNAEIAFNSFGGNRVAGIFVGGSRGPYTGTYIHDNVMNGDVIKSCDLTGVLCANNSA